MNSLRSAPLRRLSRLSVLVLVTLSACEGREVSPMGPAAEEPQGPTTEGENPIQPTSDPWSPAAIGISFTVEELRSGAVGERALQCAGPLHQPTEYEEYVEAFSAHPPAMWVTYYSLVDARFTPDEKLAVLEDQLDRYGGIPFLGISYTQKLLDGSHRGWDPEVAAGLFDDEIRAIARAIAEDGRPVLLRPGFEFNGAWNNYKPQSYRALFVHIRLLFSDEGADNVIWVWNAHPAGKVAPFMEFYPGDDAVDWWGVNFFGQAFDSPSQSAFTAEFVAGAKARGKPLIVPESVPTKTHLLDDPTTWAAWFTPYFDLIRDEGFGAFCYSNRDYTKVPAWSDWGGPAHRALAAGRRLGGRPGRELGGERPATGGEVTAEGGSASGLGPPPRRRNSRESCPTVTNPGARSFV